MKNGINMRPIIAPMCIIIGMMLFGCLGTSKVTLKNYSPLFTRDYSVYKGKPVYLMNFENQAKDTSLWYYFSTDHKFSYSSDSFIHNYFWYAFHDALVKIGMLVSNVDNPDLSAPAMWLTLKSITDEWFIVQVTVQRKGVTVFSEVYELKEPSLPDDDRTPANLEKRAYRMTSRLFETILDDPGFKKIFKN